ncbi:MAG TPA: diaminopimelate epimerase [Burkholderiaceae bacterium]|nr:diaminopimelate epimerase [Burkholderiaceae bacterium]
MRFVKMHGLGNAYVFFNVLGTPDIDADWPALAQAVSDVHVGIGSDGLILVGPGVQADFSMRIFNADGSEGQTCGNGLRCVAKLLRDEGWASTDQFSIETRGGVVQVALSRQSPGCSWVKVNMGVPGLRKADVPMLGMAHAHTINEPVQIGADHFQMTCVSMGNPHAILFVDNVATVPLAEWGPRIEHAHWFPERVNVGVVAVRNQHELDYRVWERGSGLTMACGSGACAAVVAACLNGKVRRDVPVCVHLPGGDLTIQWASSGHVWMTGPAQTVCEGDIDVSMGKKHTSCTTQSTAIGRGDCYSVTVQ